MGKKKQPSLHASRKGVDIIFKFKRTKNSEWEQLDSVQSISFSKIVEYSLFRKPKYNIAGTIICTGSKESYEFFFKQYPKYYAVQISFVDNYKILNIIELYNFKLANMGAGLSIDDTNSEIQFVYMANGSDFIYNTV